MLTGGRAAVIGLGLIGGSLAKALKAYTGYTVFGLDADPETERAARHAGAVDECIAPVELARAELIFLALCPGDVVQFIKENHPYIRPGTVVAHCCGVQARVMSELTPLAAKHGFLLLGAHPMAGKESGGFQNSEAGLFQGASLLLVPAPGAEPAAELLEGLAPRLGFRQAVRTTAKEHDRIISYTSQLPHVLACAYVNSPSCLRHEGFSAGSYKDVSRVARINEAMWTELFLANRDPLTEELDILIKNLSLFRDAIQADDAETLSAMLKSARERKESVG